MDEDEIREGKILVRHITGQDEESIALNLGIQPSEVARILASVCGDHKHDAQVTLTREEVDRIREYERKLLGMDRV